MVLDETVEAAALLVNVTAREAETVTRLTNSILRGINQAQAQAAI